MPVGYPQSLLSRLREGQPSPALVVQLSSTYFDLADDWLKDNTKRIEAYEAGAKAAKQVYKIDDSNADAHCFHAVNLDRRCSRVLATWRWPSRRSNAGCYMRST
jgi:hypothetical protein